MTDGAPTKPRGRVRDAQVYERRLRAGMRLMARKDRDAVTREIMGGVQAQAAARGGEFEAVVADLDDPHWVGRQMVKVYGVAPLWTAAAALSAAMLAWASAPGALVGPATDPAAIVTSLAAFGALLAVLFLLIVRQMTGLAVVAALAGVATRVLALLVPQDLVPLVDLFTAGELAVYLLATALLVVVAGAPALALHLRGDGE